MTERDRPLNKSCEGTSQFHFPVHAGGLRFYSRELNSLGIHAGGLLTS